MGTHNPAWWTATVLLIAEWKAYRKCDCVKSDASNGNRGKAASSMRVYRLLHSAICQVVAHVKIHAVIRIKNPIIFDLSTSKC